jgi:hypothetical protein
MWNGYLAMGGLEVLNSPRAVAYSRSAGCPSTWLSDPDPCDTLEEALGHTEYDAESIQNAPWYDARVPESARFYGAYVIALSNLSDATTEAESVQRIGAGSVVTGIREASRRVRATVMLTAEGMDALEHGAQWLKATTKANACGVHGDACGKADLEFFVSCPPSISDYPMVQDWEAAVDANLRHLHNVSRISGPLTEQEMMSEDGRHYGRIVQLIFEAETPWVFSKTRTVDLPPTIPSIIEDTPYNLVKNPSANAVAGTVVVARNLSKNPSAEVNITDWLTTFATISGTSPSAFLTTARSNDIAAEGSWSVRTRLLGNNGTTAVTNAKARLTHYQSISLAGLSPLTRISFNAWGGVLIQGGASGSVVDTLSAFVAWFNSGGTQIATTALGTASASEKDGRAFSLGSVQIPAGAVTARLTVQAEVTWSSSATAANNSDIRFYADAFAATIP